MCVPCGSHPGAQTRLRHSSEPKMQPGNSGCSWLLGNPLCGSVWGGTVPRVAGHGDGAFHLRAPPLPACRSASRFSLGQSCGSCRVYRAVTVAWCCLLSSWLSSSPTCCSLLGPLSPDVGSAGSVLPFAGPLGRSGLSHEFLPSPATSGVCWDECGCLWPRPAKPLGLGTGVCAHTVHWPKPEHALSALRNTACLCVPSWGTERAVPAPLGRPLQGGEGAEGGAEQAGNLLPVPGPWGLKCRH